METKFQASFIPKQPVNVPSKGKTSGSSIFILISFIIFMLSVVSAAGVFFWDKYVDKTIANGNVELTKNRNAFDPNTIQQFARLGDRIETAETLLKRHVAVSTLFKVLADTTLKSLRFSSFKFSYGGGEKIGIQMAGEAVSYEAVALQARAFTNPELRNAFKSPLLSDPNLDSSGNVTFSFSSGVDPTLVNYYKIRQSMISENKVQTNITDNAADNNAAASNSDTFQEDTSAPTQPVTSGANKTQ